MGRFRVPQPRRSIEDARGMSRQAHASEKRDTPYRTPKGLDQAARQVDTSRSSSGHATPRVSCFTDLETSGRRPMGGKPSPRKSPSLTERQRVRFERHDVLVSIPAGVDPRTVFDAPSLTDVRTVITWPGRTPASGMLMGSGLYKSTEDGAGGCSAPSTVVRSTRGTTAPAECASPPCLTHFGAGCRRSRTRAGP